VTEALKRAPNSIRLTEALVDVHNYAGRRAEAVKLYRELLRRDGNHVVALNNLACLLAYEPGKAEEAQPLVEKAIGLAGRLPDLLDTRALVLLQAGQADRAIKDATEAIARAPSAAGQFRLAQAQLQRGKRQEATAAFRKATQLGLTEGDLSPLERPAYREVARALQ
jgi:tetratricopeptide (TPR) repeat protein